jgi:hypothetical protein
MILKPTPTKPMPFLCTKCKIHRTWYRHGQLVVVSCSYGSIALDYNKLPVIPQKELEWRALFSDWFEVLLGRIDLPMLEN